MGSYKGEPHLWRRTNGQIYIVFKPGPHAPYQRISTGTDKLAAAEALLRAFKEKHHRSGRAPRRLTLGLVAKDWLAEREAPRLELSAPTLREYRVTVRRLAESSINRVPIADVVPADLRDFLSRFERQGASSSLIRRTILHFRMLFRWALRQDLIRFNPAEALEVPPKLEAVRPAISADQIQQARSVIGAELEQASTESERRRAQDLADLTEVLWLSGLRLQQLCRVTWDEIDLERATWTIRAKKNKGGVRLRPIHSGLLATLRRRRLLGEAGPFPDYWHALNVMRWFRERHPDMAFLKARPSRRGFITRLVEAEHLAAAKHLGDHRSEQMTDLYAQVNPEVYRSALESL